MYPYITCLGVDGQLHLINKEAKLVFDDHCIPIGWKMDPIPEIKLIEVVPEFNPQSIESHPLRKALGKYLAAKEHHIVEKQRPQDITMAEALEKIREALRPYFDSENEVENVLQKHFPS